MAYNHYGFENFPAAITAYDEALKNMEYLVQRDSSNSNYVDLLMQTKGEGSLSYLANGDKEKALSLALERLTFERERLARNAELGAHQRGVLLGLTSLAQVYDAFDEAEKTCDTYQEAIEFVTLMKTAGTWADTDRRLVDWIENALASCG